jgi:hypothetical protein
MPRRFQFSLRWLLVVMGCAGFLLAEIRALGGSPEDLKAFALLVGVGALCVAVCVLGWCMIFAVRAVSTCVAHFLLRRQRPR